MRHRRWVTGAFEPTARVALRDAASQRNGADSDPHGRNLETHFWRVTARQVAASGSRRSDARVGCCAATAQATHVIAPSCNRLRSPAADADERGVGSVASRRQS